MKCFSAGFASVDATPQLGIAISGYYVARDAKKILDPLEAICVAFHDGERLALIATVDCLGLPDEAIARMKSAIRETLDVEEEAIFIHSSHTHTGPWVDLAPDAARHKDDAASSLEKTRIYLDFLVRRVADAAVMAAGDLAPAEISIARSKAERISFGRRYLMKDGKIRTNPGVGNPDILSSVSQCDEELQLVRIDRAGKKPIAVINFQTHPDVVGGENISTDWPGFARRTFTSALDGDVRTVFINGAQGDINHVCVNPAPGELNGMANDFDDVYRGYEHAKHMGRVVAGAALSVWGKCVKAPAGKISCRISQVRVPSQMPAKEDMPLAREYVRLHRAGRDCEIPYEGMELTTAVADAERKVRMEHGPEFFDLPVSVIAIGQSLAFAGFPGEPFNQIGFEVKRRAPFAMTVPACIVNGYRGYFPFSDAYEQGGYESKSSDFGPSVAADLVEGAIKSLNALHGSNANE